MGTRVILENITKRFGEVVAVDNLSLTVEPGELFTLLGPSGCGKTTLLRTIAGLESADEGRIIFDDDDVTNLPPHRRKIALVFQSYALFPFLNVFDNIAYGLKVQGLSRSEIRKRVMEAISLVRLEGLENRRIDQLSGGQRQRVAVARAIVTRPRVLLMDEPLSNLDAKLRVEMRSEIKELQRNLGITIIYVTHDQEEALSISNRVAVMSSGKILQIGKPWDVYENPVNSFVADFIGTTNILEGKMMKRKGEILIDVSGWLLKVDSPNLNHLKISDGERIMVSMRPEDLKISKSSGLQNEIDAKIVEVQYLGKFVKYKVETENGLRIFVEEVIQKGKFFSENEIVKVGVKPEDIRILLS